eukprot:TRINITY_DN6089_c0_g1_i2.p1 TRINITY_DN6089_c0_g1~~TRINITY_DN6089_c0_g1_i2.p1  ORF type:complete len:190 (+),score=65.48 TRINITY_DN6089_c0_g1_i2:78-572(+)
MSAMRRLSVLARHTLRSPARAARGCAGEPAGVNTHHAISRELCGRPVALGPGSATVEMEAAACMAADAQGLTHGGFYFGMADYAAMLAVNDPNVVLGAASSRFLKPVRTGDRLQAQAKIVSEKGKKREVEVTINKVGPPPDSPALEQVFSGTFTCFVLPKHVLS